MEEVDVPRQINGYDCGIYTVIYAGMFASNIINRNDPKLIGITPEEVSKCRKALKQKVSEMKEAIEKKKKSNETEQNGNKKVGDNNGGQANATDDVCWRYINYRCWRGENCIFKHPILCESDIHKTYCGSKTDPCDLYHPQVCSTYLLCKVCKWGDRCKFRHVDNNVQRHSHESNGAP